MNQMNDADMPLHMVMVMELDIGHAYETTKMTFQTHKMHIYNVTGYPPPYPEPTPCSPYRGGTHAPDSIVRVGRKQSQPKSHAQPPYSGCIFSQSSWE